MCQPIFNNSLPSKDDISRFYLQLFAFIVFVIDKFDDVESGIKHHKTKSMIF
jgi:hypothetical protein